MRPVRETFELALADPGAVDAAMTTAQAFLATHPEHPVAMAYLGSLNGLKAGAALLPWIKLRHANVAIELLESAYLRRNEAGQSQDAEDDIPGELVILLLRGIAYANFPSFMGLGDAAQESLGSAVRHPDFCRVPGHHRALACTLLKGGSAGLDLTEAETRPVP